jgi:hypothetical protein
VLVTRAYFIPIGARPMGRLLVCDFCVSHFAPPDDADLGLLREWKRSDGLGPLMRNADPGLPLPPPNEPPTKVAVEALLRTLDERTPVANQEVTRGLWTGGLAGGTLGAVIGAVLSLAGWSLGPGPTGEQFIPCALFGAFAGLVLGGINEARRQGPRPSTKFSAGPCASIRSGRRRSGRPRNGCSRRCRGRARRWRSSVADCSCCGTRAGWISGPRVSEPSR